MGSKYKMGMPDDVFFFMEDNLRMDIKNTLFGLVREMKYGESIQY